MHTRIESRPLLELIYLVFFAFDADRCFKLSLHSASNRIYVPPCWCVWYCIFMSLPVFFPTSAITCFIARSSNSLWLSWFDLADRSPAQCRPETLAFLHWIAQNEKLQKHFPLKNISLPSIRSTNYWPWTAVIIWFASVAASSRKLFTQWIFFGSFTCIGLTTGIHKWHFWCKFPWMLVTSFIWNFNRLGNFWVTFNKANSVLSTVTLRFGSNPCFSRDGATK